MDSKKQFPQKLLEWYSVNKRDLPWRKEDVTPYHVVVSEIMLQQTQVSRVIVKYHEFLERFPTIFDLANAPSADVIQMWSGLGYNRRALMLHKFAQEVVERYDGVIPSVPEALIKLSGIGAYAAGSIASFAFNRPEPAIDVNVRRIFHRYFDGIDKGLPGSRVEEKKLFRLVKEVIPSGRSRDFHNALMDFGSAICLRNNPKCGECVMAGCRFAPLYEEKKEKVMFVKEKRVEPGRVEEGKHIPNRIFRGRIVEFVRKNAGVMLIDELGRTVKEDYSVKDREWLLGLCEKLSKDKLIVFEKRGKEVALGLG